MDSLDTDHVPPPDPANFFEFALKQDIPLSGYPGPRVSVELLDVAAERAYIRMHYNGQDIHDWLNLDKPCVALRDTIARPYLTFTLRRVDMEFKKAWLQITAPSKVHQVAR